MTGTLSNQKLRHFGQNCEIWGQHCDVFGQFRQLIHGLVGTAGITLSQLRQFDLLFFSGDGSLVLFERKDPLENEVPPASEENNHQEWRNFETKEILAQPCGHSKRYAYTLPF